MSVIGIFRQPDSGSRSSVRRAICPQLIRRAVICSLNTKADSKDDSANEETIVTPETISITDVAEAFFDACETGKGWEVCSAYCTPNATFAAQAEPLLEVKTLAQYTDWMKGMLSVLPDARYEVKSFATDSARNNVAAYGVFYGTHTGQGGPVPPTGRAISTDYVYVMQFDGDRIAHMTKIWNAGMALKDLGWS